METSYLYSLAEKEKLEVFDYKFEDNIGGVYLDKQKAIGLDKSLTEIERKCTFAEELGHYYCNAVYPISCSDECLIDRKEYRAKKWSVKTLIPSCVWQRLKDMELQYKWEIAEELGVTEDLVEKAATLYC